jgi:hypothetical protein
MKRAQAATGATQKLSDAAKKAKEEQERFNKSLADSFNDMFAGIARGESAMKGFKGVLGTIMSELTRKLSSNLANSLTGENSLLGGLIGKASGFLGNMFGSFLPSFDIGSYNVPSDMVANVHKGEMIIPASQAAQIRSGGFGGASIVQNITIGDNVSASVRQEISKMLPELKRATVEAVQDSRLRKGGASI